MGSVVKETISDLTALLLWNFICIFLIGYGVASIYTHAGEIYQIVQVYNQIVNNPDLVVLLNEKFEILGQF